MFSIGTLSGEVLTGNNHMVISVPYTNAKVAQWIGRLQRNVTKLICPNVHSWACTLSAPMMLLCCSLASSSFTPRKFSFLSDDHLKSRMYSVWWFLLITMPSSLRFQQFVKHCRVEIIAFPFVLFHRDCFVHFFICHLSKCSAARLSTCFCTLPHIVAFVCSPLCHQKPWTIYVIYIMYT